MKIDYLRVILQNNSQYYYLILSKFKFNPLLRIHASRAAAADAVLVESSGEEFGHSGR
jgi:hypothetical protein